MPARPPRILFLSLTDDVGSERIVAEMGRRGAICAVMGRPGSPAALASRVDHRHDLPRRGGPWAAAARVGQGLAAVCASWRPDAAVPLDDMAAGLLRDIALSRRTTPAVRALLVSSLGDPLHFGTAVGRAPLIAAAARLGVRTPAQAAPRGLAEARAAALDVGFPLMVKREGTCGGSGVTPVATPDALDRAYRAAARRAAAKRALKRLFGFGGGAADDAVTLQARVEGRLAMRTLACTSGRVLAGMSFEAESLDPPVTGSSTVVRPLDHPGMAEAARRIVAALGCSGFVSFDFILDSDGAAHLIEMNARPVGSGHLGALFGHDLYGAWLRRFPGFVDAAPPSDGPAPEAVALFPKEMARDPDSARIDAPGVLHDVPAGEPAIVAAGRARVLARHPDAGPALARRLGGGPPAGAPAPWRPANAARLRA